MVLATGAGMRGAVVGAAKSVEGAVESVEKLPGVVLVAVEVGEA